MMKHKPMQLRKGVSSVSLTAALQCIVISLKLHFGNGVGEGESETKKCYHHCFLYSKRERKRERGGKTFHKYGRKHVSLSTVKNKKEKNTHKNSLAEGSGWV